MQVVHPLQGNTLCPLSQSGSKLCVWWFGPVTFHPAISIGNHSSHKNIQKNDANALLAVRERAQACLLTKEHGAGSTDWRAAPTPAAGGCTSEPHPLSHVSRHKGRLLLKITQLK